MAVVVVLTRADLAHPLGGGLLIGSALTLTAAYSLLWRSRPELLLRPRQVILELGVGAALVLLDGWVYRPGHVFSTSQSLGSVWPLIGVLSAGIALGSLPALGAGVALGACRLAGALLNGAGIDTAGKALSLINTAVLYSLAGWLAGYLYRLLFRAERAVAASRAREEFARTLHDGVLQTLALVERRTDDPALARLARDQERELREFLVGTLPAVPGASADLGAALRAAGARYEGRFGGRVQVLVADDLPSLDADQAAALVGAVGEALANAGKHSGASQVTVYLEPAEASGVFCSVKDDGVGFVPAAASERLGIPQSIRGRVEQAGGRAEIVSAPGFGTEVRLWLP